MITSGNHDYTNIHVTSGFSKELRNLKTPFLKNFIKVTFLKNETSVQQNDANKTYKCSPLIILNLENPMPLLYRNKSINLLSKSIDWFLYETDISR